MNNSIFARQKRRLMNDKLDHILQETTRLFLKYGIHSLSMDDICRELKISKKTLYQYIANKTDLVDRVLKYIIEKIDTRYQVSTEGYNAIDQLLSISRKVGLNMQNFNPTMTFDLQKYYPDLFRWYVQARKEVHFSKVVANMEQGISEGLFRNDLDVSLVSRIYIQKLQAILDPEFLTSDEFSFETVFRVMFDNHIRGISNERGITYYESIK